VVVLQPTIPQELAEGCKAAPFSFTATVTRCPFMGDDTRSYRWVVGDGPVVARFFADFLPPALSGGLAFAGLNASY
jgi:hypothetical protein